MRTDNLDKVLSRVTGAECKEAAEELERYLDAGLAETRELLAAFLNDLNNECLVRWGPRGERVQPGGPTEPPLQDRQGLWVAPLLGWIDPRHPTGGVARLPCPRATLPQTQPWRRHHPARRRRGAVGPGVDWSSLTSAIAGTSAATARWRSSAGTKGLFPVNRRACLGEKR